jgi:hypothetical protein
MRQPPNSPIPQRRGTATSFPHNAAFFNSKAVAVMLRFGTFVPDLPWQ